MAKGQEILDAHVELQHELDAARKQYTEARDHFFEVKNRVLAFREQYKEVLRLFAIAQISENTEIRVETPLPRSFLSRLFGRG